MPIPFHHPTRRAAGLASLLPATLEALEARRLLSAAALTAAPEVPAPLAARIGRGIHAVPAARTTRTARAARAAASVMGTGGDDTITISRDPRRADWLLVDVNGRQTSVPGTNAIIDGGAGNDRIVVSARYGYITTPFVVRGGAGDDLIAAGADYGSHPIPAVFDGGDGNDTLIAADGGQTLYGGGGNDLVYGGNGNDLIYGDYPPGPLPAGITRGRQADGNDTLYGSSGDDTLDGNGGNDSISGGIGHDVLIGGPGDDTLLGGLGNDTLVGDTANDLYGAPPRAGGHDRLDGGPGNDTLLGSVNSGPARDIPGTGRDTLIGGAGQNVFDAGRADKITDFNSGDRTVAQDTVTGPITFTQTATIKLFVPAGRRGLAELRLPAGIGLIGSTPQMYTADAQGTIMMQSAGPHDFEVGQLFEEWGVAWEDYHLGRYYNQNIVMKVNGTVNNDRDDYVIRNGDAVEIDILGPLGSQP